jgi:hypothetical protein
MLSIIQQQRMLDIFIIVGRGFMLEIFIIEEDGYFISLKLIDFQETDTFDKGFYFDCILNLKCPGYVLETTIFNLNNNILYNFYECLKGFRDFKRDELNFYSISKELNISLKENERKKLDVTVNFHDLHFEDIFQTNLCISHSSLQLLIDQISLFFQSFPIKKIN